MRNLNSVFFRHGQHIRLSLDAIRVPGSAFYFVRSLEVKANIYFVTVRKNLRCTACAPQVFLFSALSSAMLPIVFNQRFPSLSMEENRIPGVAGEQKNG